jgi:hypothetical protein
MGKAATEATADDAPRVRLIADADETLNAAVQLRASKQSVVEKRRVSKSDVITSILREALADEIAEIERYSAGSKKPKK